MKQLLRVLPFVVLLNSGAYGKDASSAADDTQALRAELARIQATMEAMGQKIVALEAKNVEAQTQFGELISGKLTVEKFRVNHIDMGVGTIDAEPNTIALHAGGGKVNVSGEPFLQASGDGKPLHFFVVRWDGNVEHFSDVNGRHRVWDSGTSGR